MGDVAKGSRGGRSDSGNWTLSFISRQEITKCLINEGKPVGVVLCIQA